MAWDGAIKVSLKTLEIGGQYQGFFPQPMIRRNFEWVPIGDDHFAVSSSIYPSTTLTRSVGSSIPRRYASRSPSSVPT
ncbi:hypothetical protein ACYOEI_22165 [Singulisphaera rosea]